MARKEIPQDPIVKIVDDYSGQEISNKTKESRYQFNGKTYDLYLSAESKKAVDDFITKLTKNAEEVGAGRATSIQIKPGHDLDEVRKWAKKNGYAASDKRRAPNKTIAAFNDAMG